MGDRLNIRIIDSDYRGTVHIQIHSMFNEWWFWMDAMPRSSQIIEAGKSRFRQHDAEGCGFCFGCENLSTIKRNLIGWALVLFKNNQKARSKERGNILNNSVIITYMSPKGISTTLPQPDWQQRR